MDIDSTWDWPLLMYTATVLLRRTEAEFWKMTPRKLNVLTKVHVEVNNRNEEQSDQGYIDQIF